MFDELLLDWDPACNAANWMWLSCSAFFSQYYRVYSPVAFPVKVGSLKDLLCIPKLIDRAPPSVGQDRPACPQVLSRAERHARQMGVLRESESPRRELPKDCG